jgi:hypothetical protein
LLNSPGNDLFGRGGHRGNGHNVVLFDHVIIMDLGHPWLTLQGDQSRLRCVTLQRNCRRIEGVKMVQHLMPMMFYDLLLDLLGRPLPKHDDLAFGSLLVTRERRSR